MDEIKLLDVVALIEDLPSENLHRGEVGAVVEMLAPEVYEVEFCDREGRTYAMLPLKQDQLMKLRYRDAAA
ncbi:MAG: DUF4926 domain-containing protein [Acidobacteriota bacterium]